MELITILLKHAQKLVTNTKFKPYLPVPEVKSRRGPVLFKIEISASTFSPGRADYAVIMLCSN